MRSAVTQVILDDRVLTTPIVVAEVAQGVRTPRELQLLLSDFRAYHMVRLDEDVAELAARLLFALARTGQRVPVTDALVAAASIAADAELWHLSDEHYDRLATVAPEALGGRSLTTRAFSRQL